MNLANSGVDAFASISIVSLISGILGRSLSSNVVVAIKKATEVALGSMGANCPCRSWIESALLLFPAPCDCTHNA